MCGIAGILNHSAPGGPKDAETLGRMTSRMAPRGPDGQGLWHSPEGRVSLGHRRLAIIDLSPAGAQPMADPETGNVIVFNGEIYNYRELRAGLESAGSRFRSASDTEVLLHLYRREGPSMLPRLRGMYAFAIWEEARKRLFLARDPFGIKPLYLAEDGKTLRFASQVKALLAGGGLDTSPEPAGHVGFFLWGHVPEPFTLYRGIRALPAGTWLRVGLDGRQESGRHFHLASELGEPALDHPPRSPGEARELLAAALRESVRHHLVADVPVGVFLSSGKDSSTLAALAAEAGQGPVRSFTLGFREFIGTPQDEVPLAESVARVYGTNHETRWVGREDFEADLGRLLDAMDQPSIDGVNTYFVAKAAGEAGLKVALSGLGGDEIFAGYPGFREIPLLARWLRPAALFPGLGRGVRRLASPVIGRFFSPKYAGLLEYGGRWAGAYLLRRSLFMPWELPGLLEPDFVREGWERLQTLQALGGTLDGVGPDRLKVTALEASWYMRNQLLRDTDWASMAHSLEVRVPLVDVPLLRTVAALVHAGFPVGKAQMCATPRRPLPREVLQRPKTGFSVPVREWLMEASPEALRHRGLRGWAKYILVETQKWIQALGTSPADNIGLE